MTRWATALELSADRVPLAGSVERLAEAVRRGADLRIGTDFHHDEHIDPGSADHQLVREVSDFPVTYLVDGRRTAGVMTLRQPVSLSHEGFGRPSMSFFLYNDDGSQGIARPFLDGGGPEPVPDHSAMPHYAEGSRWDDDTTAPSSDFVYRFERYRFLVRDRWREVAHTTLDGSVVSGSLADLTGATDAGAAVKVGIRGLIDEHPEHELFVECGPVYHYTESALLVTETRPLVRVRASAPMTYRSANWDFGWLIARTDGRCHYLRYDPYTLDPASTELSLELRWFVDEGVSSGEMEDLPE